MKIASFRSFGLLIMALGAMLLLGSCASTKSLDRGMRKSTGSLYYGSNTTPYCGARPDIVFLRDVGASNMDFHSHVSRRSSLVIPLFYYNYIGHRYDVRLGEQSLKTPFRPFFIDALIAESDYSGNYRIETAVPDSIVDRVYTLDVSFDSISTRGSLKYRDHAVFVYFLDESGEVFANLSDYKLRDLRSGIAAHITLTRGCETVLDRSYDIVYPVSQSIYYADDGLICNNLTADMTRALSEATVRLVSSIVADITQALAERGGACPLRAVGE